MKKMRFVKELYPKIALIKAAFNFTDVAYMHLDSDQKYYYVYWETKPGNKEVCEKDFINEMLSQSLRHEVYVQTKSIRELLLARAMATSVVIDEGTCNSADIENEQSMAFDEKEILKDWFERND